MRTGQTSQHAPHSVEASASSLAAGSSWCSSGVRTAPIGPAYTDPYAWPPTWR